MEISHLVLILSILIALGIIALVYLEVRKAKSKKAAEGYNWWNPPPAPPNIFGDKYLY